MKMAVQYWMNRGVAGRTKILSFRGGYHGDTFATMAVCDPEEGMHAKFAGVFAPQLIGDLPRDGAALAGVRQLVEAHAYELASILVEPRVQGAGGLVFHEDQVLRDLRQLADDFGLLLIFDEIFTGFGRTGAMFACAEAGVTPDIVTLSKALTGGTLPLAATLARKHVFDAFWGDEADKALMHGPTYMGNALACAAANASLDLFESEPRLAQVARIAALLEEGLAPCRALPGVTDVRVMGAIGVVEMEAMPEPRALQAAFLDRGVWIRPFRNVVYLTPAFVIADGELEQLTGTVAAVLSEALLRA
jgi:adenosylmethionine-8-amino-7-oxononanoate aminotransferase